jgi:hypothetical protein
MPRLSPEEKRFIRHLATGPHPSAGQAMGDFERLSGGSKRRQYHLMEVANRYVRCYLKTLYSVKRR